jgi:hypothetical protein
MKLPVGREFDDKVAVASQVGHLRTVSTTRATDSFRQNLHMAILNEALAELWYALVILFFAVNEI